MENKDYIGKTYTVHNLRVADEKRGSYKVRGPIEVMDFEHNERGEWFVLIPGGLDIEAPGWEEDIMTCDPWDLIEQIDPSRAQAERSRADQAERHESGIMSVKTQDYRDIPLT